jgi:ABC-2 type transport system permease protein
MKPMITLIRREFWEHRSLWILPLAGVAFLLGSAVVLAVKMSDVQFGPKGMFRGNPGFGAPPGTDVLTVTIFVFSALIYGLGALAVFSYALDCLYSERKDRSILFWKSLPVSDTRTVLSKVLVALVVMPLLITAMAIVTNLISGLILSINPSAGSPVRTMWDLSRLLPAYGHLIASTAVNALWFAPLIVYAMLASVLSPRLPHVSALVPLIVVCVGEKMLFDTSHALAYIGARFTTRYNVEQALGSPHLWIGVLAAAAGIVLAIRLRRWRDDS